MTPELAALIEQARRRPPMTPEEIREQEICFAYGNLAVEHPYITKEGVRRAMDRIVRDRVSLPARDSV